MVDLILPSRETLDAFVPRFIQDARHPERIVPRPEWQTDFLTLFGVIQRVRRLAQACLRLRTHGCQDSDMARSMEGDNESGTWPAAMAC